MLTAISGRNWHVSSLRSILPISLPQHNAHCNFCKGTGSKIYSPLYTCLTLRSILTTSLPQHNAHCDLYKELAVRPIAPRIHVSSVASILPTSLPQHNVLCKGIGSKICSPCIHVSSWRSILPIYLPQHNAHCNLCKGTGSKIYIPSYTCLIPRFHLADMPATTQYSLVSTRNCEHVLISGVHPPQYVYNTHHKFPQGIWVGSGHWCGVSIGSILPTSPPPCNTQYGLWCLFALPSKGKSHSL